MHFGARIWRQRRVSARQRRTANCLPGPAGQRAAPFKLYYWGPDSGGSAGQRRTLNPINPKHQAERGPPLQQDAREEQKLHWKTWTTAAAAGLSKHETWLP